MSELTYRDYQSDSIDRIREEWASGNRSTLLVMATGGGKTIVFLSLMDETIRQDSNCRWLILAHREKLIFQPIEKMAKFWPHLAGKAGIVMAERNNVDKRVIVATVQTLAMPGRLDEILSHGAITHLITDEAHHAVSDTYMDVYRKLQRANPDLYHLGVTATPVRLDKKALRGVYQSVAAKYGIAELVEKGWLVKPRWLGVSVNAKTPKGQSEMSFTNSILRTTNAHELIVKTHKKFADGRKTIVFVGRVETAYELADVFSANGVPAAAIHAGTKEDERKRIELALRKGELEVVVNVDLWTEGVDIEEINCIHMASATDSDSRYLQRAGRGLRPFPGKEDCLIFDYLPLDSRNVTLLGDLLGGNEEEMERFRRQSPDEDGIVGGAVLDANNAAWFTGDPNTIMTMRLDYLEQSKEQWVQLDSRGWMCMGFGMADDGIERSIALSPPAEKMELWVSWRKDGERKRHARLYREGTFEQLADVANELIRRHAPRRLAFKAAKWRSAAPTEGQARFGQRLNVYEPGMTRGQLADAITYRLTTRVIKRERGKL